LCRSVHMLAGSNRHCERREQNSRRQYQDP
jgi:hypothetical protein